MSKSETQALSIGAVTKITGIPADTLRTWERRYEVVVPARDASGRRAYSRADVARLSAIGRLATLGERVSDLASLSAADLNERLDLHMPSERKAPERIGLAVVHPTGALALAGPVRGEYTRLEIVAHAEVPEQLSQLPESDVLLADLPLLGADPVGTLRELQLRAQPRCTVVTYHYASRPERALLEAQGVRLVKGPTSSEQLREIVLEHLMDSQTPVEELEAPCLPAPILSRENLERLLRIKPDLACECPNHLAALAIAMREFELYSQRCESNGAEDAVLHNDLAIASGKMRSKLEQLVLRVCAHEGIPLG